MKEIKDFLKNKLSKEDIYYKSGRCHLFALVSAEILNTNINALWDIDAMDDDLNPIGKDCLVHAYVEIKDKIYDIEGLNTEDILYQYPCNQELFKSHSIEDFKKVIKAHGWCYFEENEYEELKNYIKDDLIKKELLSNDISKKRAFKKK